MAEVLAFGMTSRAGHAESVQVDGDRTTSRDDISTNPYCKLYIYLYEKEVANPAYRIQNKGSALANC
jgi:hypothetical protein